MGMTQGSIFTTIVAGALARAVAGFLLFNFLPERVFMGDGGSLFLGFSLAVLAVPASGTGVPIGVPIILFAIPILDTLTAILRRLRHRFLKDLTKRSGTKQSFLSTVIYLLPQSPGLHATIKTWSEGLLLFVRDARSRSL